MKDLKSEVPGPGNYNINVQEKGKGFSLSIKHPSEKPSQVPGPGAYTPKINNKSNGNRVISKARRASLIDESVKRQVPGPGMYKPKLGLGTSAIIGSERRDTIRAKDGPGPGQYDFISTIGNRGLMRNRGF